MGWHDEKTELPSHTRGAPKGEELVRKYGREAGRKDRRYGRTARDATSVNPEDRDPIDPRMPHMPPP